MVKYPIFVNLEGRRVVVIGGGGVAHRKIEVLAGAGAEVLVVAKNIIKEICEGPEVKLIEGEYKDKYLDGAVLVIAATSDNDLNRKVYDDCRKMRLLCNVVDVPELCDFFVPAVARRGDLQIAIGTEGHCPAYAAHIRRKLEAIFTDKHGEFLVELGAMRKKVIEMVDAPNRKTVLMKIADDESFEYFETKGAEKWRQYAQRIIKSG